MGLPQYSVKMRIASIFHRNVEVEGTKDAILEGYNFILGDRSVALLNQTSNLWDVDFIHLKGHEKSHDCQFLPILLSDGNWMRVEVVEVGDCEILSVFGNIWMRGEDPPDCQFSKLIGGGTEWVGGWGWVIGKCGLWDALLEEFIGSKSRTVGLVAVQ